MHFLSRAILTSVRENIGQIMLQDRNNLMIFWLCCDCHLKSLCIVDPGLIVFLTPEMYIRQHIQLLAGWRARRTPPRFRYQLFLYRKLGIQIAELPEGITHLAQDVRHPPVEGLG